MRVMKFGGSCLQDGSGLPRVVQLVRAASPPVCVVLSALKGVTDQLRDLALAAAGGEPTDLAPLQAAHAHLLEPLSGEPRSAAESALNTLLSELEQALSAVRDEGLAPERLDPILGWGERTCCRIVVQHLAQFGVKAELLVGAAAGIVTDSGHGHARLLPEAAAKARAALTGERVLVVPGFVGQTPSGAWTTLGRGGSDTTAAFLGLALEAPVTLWKDTALLSADPTLVPSARVLTGVDPQDAFELAVGGLPAIAADALELAAQSSDPLEVRAFVGEARSKIASGAHTPAAVVWVAEAPEAVRVTLVGGPRERALLESRAAGCLRAAGVTAAASALTPSGRNHAWTVPAAARARVVRALHRAFVEEPSSPQA